MVCHSGDDKNDGNNDHQVVSVKLGDVCEFDEKNPRNKEANIGQESGDVLFQLMCSFPKKKSW